MLFMATVATARLAPSVAVIDGTDVVGGDPDKFSCNNLCKQNVGGGCVMAAGATCTQAKIGQVCGERITQVLVVKGCEVNPAGNVDPCKNEKPAAKCYKAKDCFCRGNIVGGQPVFSCEDAGTAVNRGDTVGSANCP